MGDEKDLRGWNSQIGTMPSKGDAINAGTVTNFSDIWGSMLLLEESTARHRLAGDRFPRSSLRPVVFGCDFMTEPVRANTKGLIGLTFLDQGQSWSESGEVGMSVAVCPSLAEGGRSPTGAKDGVSWAAKRAGLW